MFKKILIANRGEIACRIMRTAQSLGIQTVAIYSVADSQALHVQMADEAYCVGPAPSQESYLQQHTIIDIARQVNVDAIHPGYGFLSENAAFAALCAKHNIVFIGPTTEAIAAMGNKSQAKKIMHEAQVPLLPGYHGEDQSPDKLLAEAEAIGFPVLIKAASGGGGKGMRIVNHAKEFAAALASAQREALASFADDTMLIEKYLTNPRHIEIQVFADNHGNAIHLFERDCSIQRRHQKIVEEAPATNFSAKLREQMGTAAINAAKAIDYRGAGTVEFLLNDDGQFYFMEMNTRLQVEHPVTELITGVDLVAWQLQIANGEPLPRQQADIHCQGHAIEVRIYAEDPLNDFLPCTGNITYLATPEPSDNLRIDTGISEGNTITPYYDPMIAKLIVWEQDRETAIAKLQQALWDYHLVGVTTNIHYLATLIQLPAYTQAEISTQFIDHQQASLIQQLEQDNDIALLIGCLYTLLQRQQQHKHKAQTSAEANSPWHIHDNWRLNHHTPLSLDFTGAQHQHTLTIKPRQPGYCITLADKQYAVLGELQQQNLIASINGSRYQATVIEHNNRLYILGNDFYQCLQQRTIDTLTEDEADTAQFIAPMPGTIVAITSQTGAQVKQAEPILTIEAMKMEHTLYAPCDGTVTDILFNIGDMVDEGTELVLFEPAT